MMKFILACMPLESGFVDPYVMKCYCVHRWVRVFSGAFYISPKALYVSPKYLSWALIKCKYAKWALDKVERKFINYNQEESIVGNNQGELSDDDSNNPSSYPEGRDSTKEKYHKGHLVIPYTQRLGEIFKKICKKYGIQTHFKVNRTIKNILVKPKDKDPLDRKSGTMYWYQCGELTSDEEYIGETSRTFGERYKEHMKEPSTICGHSNIWGHRINPDNFTIRGREDHGLARTIKESIYIRVNNPTLSRNMGKYLYFYSPITPRGCQGTIECCIFFNSVSLGKYQPGGAHPLPRQRQAWSSHLA